MQEPSTTIHWGTFNASAFLSNHRLSTFGGSEELYTKNLLLSEAFYSPLCAMEIVLRNAIHTSLSRHFNRDDWWEALRPHPEAAGLIKSVDEARKKIKSPHPHTPSIVAELNFGFWTSLFEARFDTLLWKPLRLIFPHLPKEQRQARVIRKELMKIRQFRNRVYHYEPILFKSPAEVHSSICTLLSYLSPEALHWLSAIDRVPSLLS